MKINIWIFLSCMAIVFMVGTIYGMSLGTYAVIDHVANGLSGSTFIVNLNETKLIEEMNKTIVPQMTSIIKNSDITKK